MELLESAYTSFKARHAAHEAWRAGRSSYPSDSVPAELRVSNDERSACELYEWLANPPEKYFLYIKPRVPLSAAHGDPRYRGDYPRGDFVENAATTWTGTPLGNVRFGQPYRDSFGGRRVLITVYGNNGMHYAGTYYASADDYARIKMLKRKACGPRKGWPQR